MGVSVMVNVGKKLEGGTRSKGEVRISIAGKPLINSLKIIFTDVLPIIGHARDP
jgi:hypothetical protein